MGPPSRSDTISSYYSDDGAGFGEEVPRSESERKTDSADFEDLEAGTISPKTVHSLNRTSSHVDTSDSYFRDIRELVSRLGSTNVVDHGNFNGELSCDFDS